MVFRKQAALTIFIAVMSLVTVLNTTGNVHAAGLAIDGSNSSFFSSDTSGSVTLTTSNPNDIIIVAAGGTITGGASFNTPTASGLTFTQRTQQTDSVGGVRLGEWWALASSSFSGTITITATSDGCLDPPTCSLFAWGITGANTANPFDPNVGLPATNTGGEAPGVSVSTSNPNDMLIGLVGANGAPSGNWGVGSGFTSIAPISSSFAAAEFQVVSSTQTGVSVGFTNTGLGWVMVGDAVQAAVTSTVTATSDTTSSASNTATQTIPVSSILTTVAGSPSFTNTISTTTTATGSLASTSTTTFTSPLSTSYSTGFSSSTVLSSSTSITQTGTTTTGTSSSETTTSTSISFSTTLITSVSSSSTTTSTQITQTNTYYVLLTRIFHELEQFEALILQTLGFRVTATPVGQQVRQVILTLPALTVTPLSPVNATGVKVGLVQLKVRVTSGAAKISGAKVIFFVNGKKACTATSNASGLAACNYQATQPNTVYGWDATATLTGYGQGFSGTSKFKTA